MTHPNILEFEQRRARERQAAALRHGSAAPLAPTGANGDEHGRTRDKLAAKSGVSAQTINRAIKVRKQGAPEVQKAVESGGGSSNER